MLRNRVRCFLLAVLAFIPSLCFAGEEKRVALVVGIGAYHSGGSLPHAVNDGKAISETLRRSGFEVDARYDVDYRELATAIRDFGLKAADADVAVFYYAGHGIQVNYQNYLVPADANLNRERDLVYEALPLQLALGEISQARELGIVILDACNNNPFVGRIAARSSGKLAIGYGLAQVDAPSHTIVALATRPDGLAEDGLGEHSPFTTALIKHLQTPGVELGLLFRQVHDSVMQATDNRQEPYVYNSLGAKPFYFNPPAPNRVPVAGSASRLVVREGTGPVPFGIGRPVDPDNDDLAIEITSLPAGGTVHLGNQKIEIGNSLTPDQLTSLTFEPNSSSFGDVGRLGFTIRDTRDGQVVDEVAVSVQKKNQPPLIANNRTMTVVRNRLFAIAPVDPDGDPLSIMVSGLPEKGTIRNQRGAVQIGDSLTPDEVTRLTFEPDDSTIGRAGTFTIVVDDGRGGRSTSSVTIDVGEQPSSESADSVLTEKKQANGQNELPKPSPSADDEPQMDPLSGMFEAQSPAKIRKAPNKTAPIIGTLSVGDRVEVIGKVSDGDWYAIALPNHDRGYVYASLLREEAPQVGESAAIDVEGPAIVDNDDSPAATESKEASTTVRTLGASSNFQDCSNCPVMTRIEPGVFSMGSDGSGSEGPPVHVTIERPFAAGTYEVTVAEWKACIEGGGCTGALPRMDSGVDDKAPVHNLDWDDAQEYVKWLSRVTGRSYRLLTEAEWEYAARGGTHGPFWWGDEHMPQANCLDCGGTQERKRPLPSGSFSPNPFGLYDMNGSVAEWVEDCWYPNLAGISSNGSARESSECRTRTLRGGSWKNKQHEITATARWGYDQDVRYIANGLRIGRDLN